MGKHHMFWENKNMIQYKLKQTESIERAIKALKKKMDKESVLKELKAQRYALKPSEKKRVKSKAARKYK
jgi:small subunit ribosomal protein S21